MLNFYSLFCNLLPIQQNKVVLYAAMNRYGDNMRYLAEELLRQKRCEIVWVSEKKKISLPKGIRSICGRYAMRRELATAHVIVTDGRLSKYWRKGFIKKPGQIYIHAPYGSFELAKECADIHNLVVKDVEQAAIDSEHLDYLVSNCTWHTNNYRGSYLFSGEYIQVGIPRNDLLLNQNRSTALRTVKQKYGISHEKIVLYTPAHRPWKKAHFTVPDYEGILKALRGRFGGDWTLLIRRNPRLSENDMQWLKPSNMPTVIDAWDYPDTAELMAASDVMIGDYSSCTYDFLLTGRPTFLFTPDVAEYEKRVGFYEPVESSPMPLASDNKSLLTNISDFDTNSFKKRVNLYLAQCGNVEKGESSAQLAGLVQNVLSRQLPTIAPTRRRVFMDALYHVEKINPKKRKIYVLGFCVRECAGDVIPWSTLPIQKNKILFRSNNRMSYNCNLKYIAEEILHRHLPYDLVWIVSPYILRNIKDLPETIRPVVLGTTSALYEYATAKVWIENDLFNPYISRGLKKKKGQIWIQTWHSSLDIKKEFNKSVHTAAQCEKLFRLSRGVDFYLSGSEKEAKIRCKQFYAHGKCLRIGHPKNDILLKAEKAEIKQKVCDWLGLSTKKKLLLYAPTWREKQYKDIYTLDYARLLNVCRQKFSGDWELIGRLHYSSHYLQQQAFPLHSPVHNATEYPDSQELLVACDVLVTDYSSMASDCLLTAKPIFLYTPDIERFMQEEGFAIPIENLPFTYSKNNDDLEKNILSFDAISYRENRSKFLENVGMRYERGNAAQVTVNTIHMLISSSKV